MEIKRTARTTIEKISLEHAPFFLDLVNNPTWIEFIGDRNVKTLEDAESFLEEGLIKGYREHGYSYYLVRDEAGDSIGACGFMKKPYLEFVDFGFAYMPEYQGRGYGYEAAIAILEYGIETFGFTELDAITKLTNVASIALLKKLAFTEIGPTEIPDSSDEHLLFHWTRS